MSRAADQRRWSVRTHALLLPALLICWAVVPLQSDAAESQSPAAKPPAPKPSLTVILENALETGVVQFGDEIGQGATQSLRSLPHFERRERVDVHARKGLLDRAADREIGRAGIFRVDAALQADFGGAALPRLRAAPDDLVEVEIVGPATQVFAEFAL